VALVLLRLVPGAAVARDAGHRGRDAGCTVRFSLAAIGSIRLLQKAATRDASGLSVVC